MNEVWARCTPCGRPFQIGRHDLESYRLCPVCLRPAGRVAMGATADIALHLLMRD